MSDSPEVFDFTILGSGIACTLTLLAFLEKLRVEGRKSTVTVAVVEKEQQFWRGFPYGERSSPNSLIITTLGEFVPDAEFEEFVSWLEAEKPRWVQELRDSGEVGVSWLTNNEAAMAAGEWNEVYIPRVLYGQFAESRLTAEIERARIDGTAEVKLIQSEATDVERLETGYCVTLRHHDTVSILHSGVVLLAIGSPPVPPLDASEAAQRCYHSIENAYEPAFSENIAALQSKLEALADPDDRNFLIVGSNATALETIYMIARNTGLRNALNKVVSLSLGGRLPRKMTRDRFRPQAFTRIQALMTSTGVTARDIIAAAEMDVSELDPAKVEVGDTFHQLSCDLIDLLTKLDEEGQREFHRAYGMRFSRLIRRAGAEYRDAADELLEAGQLELLAGRFVSLQSIAEKEAARLTIVTDRGEVEHPLNFAAVLNCSGFERLSTSSLSPLIANLVRRDLATVNETGRGFIVDDNFETAANLFVCGPMLGGVFNSSARYWHVENVRRIHAISELMAPVLVARVCNE
jgi:uncharacterized NAD(P)/FAD-binding protein YdhS